MSTTIKGLGIISYGGDEDSLNSEAALLIGSVSGDSSGVAILDYDIDSVYEDGLS